MPYPVAVGHAARLLGLPARETATLFLQAFAASIVSAGVRLVPVGQTEGQRITAALLPLAAPRRRGGARRAAGGGRGLGRRRRPRGDAARDAVFAALPLVSREPTQGDADDQPLAARAAARRHRRAGRRRQDRADGPALQADARPLVDRGDHQRHLHPRGRRVPDAQPGAAAGADRRGRDRRLPAHRDPRGRLDQPRRGRRPGAAVPRPRRGADRVRAATTSRRPSRRSSPT